MNAISVDELSLHFGHGAAATQVLHDVSFTVAPGEAFGLVGESGSGKSTILRCIANLYGHWSGTITLDGRPVDRRPSREQGRRVQMVFQDPYGSLHPRHTVNTALSEPLRIHGIGKVQDRVERMLVDVGLSPDFGPRYPHQLSGGQRQRVAIARALITEPGILLLDEPTSALDVSVQAEILNLLADLRAQRDLTYILVSHDLGVVAHLCSRLAVMQSGRIVETMTTAALMSGIATEPYTRTLIQASKGYDRALVDELARGAA
ncbi:ABC transporter ATP-binding protein [Bosea sp. BK604]|uniref:ABC transporter ATP-binding protein n=1 Tax=Bosea sp. BK604 TaxID=2512180 RepID=UPI00104ABE73|nr:ABC transporter ATP-binding protein [Bosea sp. BK604]TCR65346.1 peptide/nickel transport system ATP-binding protein [Bosea sp. BK604]